MSNEEINELDGFLLEEICKKKCQFYKSGQEHSDKDYRCGAYMVLKYELEQGTITKEELIDLANNTITLEYKG
ncbi:MAG: hypothetical protein ACTSVY_04900 [Candidatus Helarchaeota archaeon]